MTKIIKAIVGIGIAATLTLGVAVPATAAVGGPEGYVGTKTGPGIANIVPDQVFGDMLGGTVDVNVTGKAYVGKIDAKLYDTKNNLVASRSVDLQGKKAYQVAWAFPNLHFKKGSRYYVTATTPAGYGHAAASLKSTVLTVK